MARTIPFIRLFWLRLVSALGRTRWFHRIGFVLALFHRDWFRFGFVWASVISLPLPTTTYERLFSFVAFFVVSSLSVSSLSASFSGPARRTLSPAAL